MKRAMIDASQIELTDKVVTIKRVTKVVKGGRNMRFTALVVVGDGNGHVGAGLGKATEIPEAIRKGREDAAKNLVSVALVSSQAALPVSYANLLESRISEQNLLAPTTSRMLFSQPLAASAS